MSYYAHHVFFCCNQREGGRVCCNDKGARARPCQQRERTRASAGKVASTRRDASTVRKACIVVYPEEVWYTYVDEHDIDEIVEEHLQHGRLVERLKI